MKRQFIVTHLSTGEQTVVIGSVNPRSHGGGDYEKVAHQLGYRYPADCDVNLVRRGREYALPFDCLPLVIKTGVLPRVTVQAA